MLQSFSEPWRGFDASRRRRLWRGFDAVPADPGGVLTLAAAADSGGVLMPSPADPGGVLTLAAAFSSVKSPSGLPKDTKQTLIFNDKS